MDKELLNFFRTKLGLSEDTPEDQVVLKIKDYLESNDTELTAATKSFKTLREQYPENSVIVTEEMQSQLDEHESLDKLRNTVLSSTREEAVKLYKILCGGDDKVDESILKMINEGNYETVIALNKQYKKQVEKDFTATCNACGSKDVSRASAANSKTGIVGADGGDGGDGDDSDKGTMDVMEHFLERKNNTSSIHDTVEK